MTTTTSTIDDLHAALDADPSNHELRAVLSDAYFDAGDIDAQECLRWMSAMEKYPREILKFGMYIIGRFVSEDEMYSPLHDDLPGVFANRDSGHWIWRSTRRACEEFVIERWRTLSPEVRERLLREAGL